MIDDHQTLARTGMPLGILEEASWGREMITFGQGDVLVAYIDGVTEVQNERGEFYGEERLIEVADLNLKQPAEELLEALHRSIHQFSVGVEQFDDITLLVVKREAKGQSKA